MKTEKVIIMPNLKETINKLNSIDKDNLDYKKIDEINWEFTHNQLLATKEFEKEDRQDYLVKNLDPSILIHPLVLNDIIERKIEETCEKNNCRPEDLVIKNLSINIDNDYNRNIEMYLDYLDNVKKEEGFDYMGLMKDQIEYICKDSLQDVLDEDKLEEFIRERIEEFEEEEYTMDYLEGVIDGYLLSRMENEDTDDEF